MEDHEEFLEKMNKADQNRDFKEIEMGKPIHPNADKEKISKEVL